MKFNRQEVLNLLLSLKPGLDSKGNLEQSECFVFKGGKAHAFNDKIMCCVDTPLELEGAFPADPLLELLTKLTVDEVDIAQTEEGIRVKTGRSKTLIRSEAEVSLPLDEVESPEEWKPLPDDFVKAITMVLPCCSRIKEPFALTCVHLHENWVEACDKVQMGRYTLDTGVKDRVIISRNSMSSVVSMNPKEFSETDTWMHFRGDGGAVLSCRRQRHNFFDLSDHVKEKGGTEFDLPKGIASVLTRCNIFSSNNDDDENIVSVSVSKGGVVLKGEGKVGWYKEKVKSDWDGDSISFKADPALLINLSKNSDKCVISEDKLRVVSGPFCFITATKQEDSE
jgi:hypothetical protein